MAFIVWPALFSLLLLISYSTQGKQFIFRELKHDVDQLSGIQATLSPNTVQAVNTDLQLFGEIHTDLNKNDFILITLPAQVQVKSAPGTLTCVFMDPVALVIQACVSLSSQVIKVTLGAPLAFYFQFNIKSAITNPESITFTDSLMFQTFRANDSVNALDYQSQGILIASTIDNIQQLQMVSTVSQVAGAINNIQFGIQIKNSVPQNGLIQVQFPYLFQDPIDNVYLRMVSQKSLLCLDLGNNGTATACNWNSTTQTVSLSQLIGSTGRAGGSFLQFTICNVTNPIATDIQAILNVSTADIYGGKIDVGSTVLQPSYPSPILNAQITADTSLVQESTRYVISFNLNVPIYPGQCPIQINLPYPDFNLALTPVTAIEGIGMFGPLRSFQFYMDLNANSVIITNACKSQVLQSIPQTIYIYGLSNPEVAKATAPISIEIWNSAGGQVAQLKTAQSPSFQITTGQVSNVSMTVPATLINSIVNFTVAFTFQHEALSSPGSSYPALIDFTFTDLNFRINPYVAVASSTLHGSSVQVSAFSPSLNKVSVTVRDPQILSGVPYTITFNNMMLAGSTQTMGPLVIQLSQQWFTGTNYQYYPIDIGTVTGLISTLQGQFLQIQIVPQSTVTFALTSYGFIITLQNQIPQGGLLLVTLPSDIYVDGGSPLCNYLGLPSACSLDSTGQSIMITGPFIGGPLPSGSQLEVDVLNIRNPRSLKTTGVFTFYSYDHKNLLIDYYSQPNTAVTMTQPASFDQAVITNVSSFRVGDSNVSYTFQITQDAPMVQGDYFKMSLPSQIMNPSFPLQECWSPQQSNLTCTLANDGSIMIIISDGLQSQIPLSFTLQGFQNPTSGVRTDSFLFTMFDFQAYQVSTSITLLDQFDLSLKMTLPFLITTGATIKTNTTVPTSAIVITIQYFIHHTLPQNSKIVITYPSQLTLNSQNLTVTSPQSTSLNGVTLNSSAYQITGPQFFSIDLSGGSVLGLVISGFSNPSTSVPTDPFSIDLFTPDGSAIDSLQQPNLIIQSKCQYPCKDCDPSSPSVCTACMTSDMGPLNLLQQGTCVSECSTGLYQFGNLCSYCDPTCGTCDVSPHICTSCAISSANKYLFNNQCVKQCASGYFNDLKNQTCDQCHFPCLSCEQGTNICSSCQAGYYLFQGTCRPDCPADYYIGNSATRTCDRCTSDCNTCQNSLDQCTTCLPRFKLNSMNNTCFQGVCPIGVTVEQTPGVCSVCDHNCETCGNNNSSYCLTCPSQLFFTPDNTCVVSCASNQAIAKVSIRECTNCQQGCAKCLDGKPDTCTACEPGLVNFKFTECLATCPVGFAVNSKSGNCLDITMKCPYGYEVNATDQCQLAVGYCIQGYEMNEFLNRCIPIPGLWIPFPTLALLLIMTTYIVIRAKCTKSQTTKLVPTIIAVWSFLELPLFIAQAFYAAQIEHWINLCLTVLAVILHFPVNWYAVHIILPDALFHNDQERTALSFSQISKQEEELDHAFKHWATNYQGFLKWLRFVALYYNHKILRALSCGYLGQPQYSAVFDRIDLHFHRPMLRLSIANMILSYTLIVIADVTALKTIVQWGYQFTIFCLESLVFVIIMAILQIVDYYQQRKAQQGFFKFKAKTESNQNVYGVAEQDSQENGLFDNENSSRRFILKRQKSKEQHVLLLQQLNDDLSHMKHLSIQYDKLSLYPEMNERKKVKWGSPQASVSGQFFKRELEESECSSDGPLSTQNHYGWNKDEFFDYEESHKSMMRDFDHLRPYNSVLSEEDYADHSRLQDFRDEFDEMLRKIIEDDLNRTKTLDYNASFHIYDKERSSDSEFDQPTGRGEKKVEEIVVLQKPPKYNLADIMGHFETDAYGKSLIVRQSIIISGLGTSPREVLIDALGRRVNKVGYLVDDEGNIVNKYGNQVIKRADLDPMTDDIPHHIFEELFIPTQGNGSRNHTRIHRKRAGTAGRQRVVTSIKQFSSSSGTAAALKDTPRVSKNARNIRSDGDSAHVTFDDEVLHEEEVSPTKVSQKKGKKRPLTGKAVVKKRIQKRKKMLLSQSYTLKHHKQSAMISSEGVDEEEEEELDVGSGNVQINIQMKSLFSSDKAKSSQREQSERLPGIMKKGKDPQAKKRVVVKSPEPAQRVSHYTKKSVINLEKVENKANEDLQISDPVSRLTAFDVQVPSVELDREIGMLKDQYRDVNRSVDQESSMRPTPSPMIGDVQYVDNSDILQPAGSNRADLNHQRRALPPKRRMVMDRDLYRVHLDVDQAAEKKYWQEHPRPSPQHPVSHQISHSLQNSGSFVWDQNLHLQAPQFLNQHQNAKPVLHLSNTSSLQVLGQGGYPSHQAPSLEQAAHQNWMMSSYNFSAGGLDQATPNYRNPPAMTILEQISLDQQQARPLNASGRQMLMRDSLNPTSGEIRFYPQRPPSTSGIRTMALSPSVSIQHRPIIPQQDQQLSRQESKHPARLQETKLVNKEMTAAYSQNLAIMANQANGPSGKKNEDPFTAQLRKIFGKRPPIK